MAEYYRWRYSYYKIVLTQVLTVVIDSKKAILLNNRHYLATVVQ